MTAGMHSKSRAYVGRRLTYARETYINIDVKGVYRMDFSRYFPIWPQLTAAEREHLSAAAVCREVKQGTLLHSGSSDCLGLLMVEAGRLRAYILSGEGREITLYRLLERDVCLLSASCMMRGAQFDVAVEAERDSTLWVIPSETYRQIMANSAPLANYTNELMAGRFADVMWLMEQVMWKSMDRRLAAFLLEEAALEETEVLPLTQERIGAHLGTAREVVTRMLRYFQGEGLVKLRRGAVELTDPAGLRALAGK